MAMQRFFIDPKYIDGNDVSFPENIEKQIRKVLRLESSDAVVVLDNTGMTYLVELEVKRGQAIKGIIVAKEPGRAEPCVGLRLCFSLSRKEKLEWIFQKCTEIGVTVFQPFISSRSIVQDIDSFESKRERYATIAKEAAEQSMRSVMPVILPVVSYEALVAEKTDGLKIIPWEETATVERMKAETFCFEEGKEPSEIRVLIGPEGGFSREEVDQAEEYGYHQVSLGDSILRMETACVVATALIRHLCETC
ncbi:MAG TPA: RsmE family RNA methyltransferase [Anaerolineaceae bacterium]|nr:RsmE family RNA methyltransferase [Anaerolineaceae bacterium]HOH91902.1 RsmE family RNA methyltransferase [Anaerolineaceae bacterium]